MKITELAIKKPVAMSMIIGIFLVLGMFSYLRIGSDLFPKVNIPFISVVTVYPGAGVKEIESQLLEPIEDKVSSISGLKTVTSTANEGMGMTVLEFKLSADSNIAAIDVQKAIDSVQGKLPKNAEKPVVYKFDFGAEPIMSLAITGPDGEIDLRKFAEDEIKAPLESVAGVGQINLFGGREREIKVELDRFKLDFYGVSINKIIERLTMENLNVPSGRLKNQEQVLVVRAMGEFNSIEDIKELLIPLPAGGNIALKELARVEDGYKEAERYGRLNSKATVGLIIQKQSDASIVEAAAQLRKEVAKIQGNLPPGFKLAVVQDDSIFIHHSLNDTKRNLLEGILMTGLVLLVFLREWRSVFIVMLAIPTSIVATFMAMYFAGFTFNILSLMGLSVCVGILVDDSIVVLENIHRHLKMGKDAKTAAIDGRQEIGMAAIAITLSDIVVFGPIAFMSGLVGQFFRQFGLTVVSATLFSLFISFTLTPMLAAKLYRKEEAEGTLTSPPKPKSFVLGRQVLKLMDPLGHKIIAFYREILNWSLANRGKVILFIAGLMVFSIALLPLGLISSEFMSKPDQGKFTMDVELPPGTSLESTSEVLSALERNLSTVPEVEDYLTTVGTSGGDDSARDGSNLGKIQVILSSKRERQRTIWQVADEVRNWAQVYPQAKINVIEAGIVGTREGAPIQLDISGPDHEVLARIAKQMEDTIKATPGTVDVSSSWKVGQPEIQVNIDRPRAAYHELSVSEITQTLRASMEGALAGVYRENDQEYDLRVRVDGLDKTNQAELSRLKIMNNNGQLVELAQVADLTEGVGPTTIRHKDRQRLISVYANLKDRSLGEVTKELETKIEGMNVPQGYKISFYGEAEDMKDSFKDLVQALLLSVVLVYMILVILYESYLTPFIRMLSLPGGIIGGLLALAITGETINIMSLIGFIMLDGLAAKNGTLLIDYTNTLMKRGFTLKDALIEAGTTRLRPIFMTSATMVFGMLPTALAVAEGSEIRSSMAVVLIGGLVVSTFITLVLIPVAYTLIEDLRGWGKRRITRGKGGAYHAS